MYICMLTYSWHDDMCKSKSNLKCLPLHATLFDEKSVICCCILQASLVRHMSKESTVPAFQHSAGILGLQLPPPCLVWVLGI